MLGWETAGRVVTVPKVRWAIQSFAPFKSSGEDNIFPAMLHHGLENMINLIAMIYRACIAYGYIPSVWRVVKVVFLPKPGKESYAFAKSFRPIGLMPVLLKGLERLVDRFLRDGVLVDRPLHRTQHAYQTGKSCESALHHLVSRIEKSLESKQFAPGYFLILKERLITPHSSQWLRHYQIVE